MKFENILKENNLQVRILPLAENVLRITHARPGETGFPAERPWFREVFLFQKPFAGEPALQSSLSDGKLQVKNRNEELVFSEKGPVIWEEKDKAVLSLQTQPDESFYGWGEWFNEFRRQNGRLELKNKESISITQGRQTYSNIPFFYSSRGYAFFLLNAHTTRWEINEDEQQIKIEMDGPPVDYLLFYGPSFKDILSTYTAFSGRPPLPPRWAFGLWVTSYPQDHQDKVIEHAQKHRDRNIPLDAVILDYHWEERFHNFRWRAELIPDPDKMIRELRRLGLRLGLIFTPFINNQNQYLKKIFLQLAVHDIPKGMLWGDERCPQEYAEAAEKGYLAHKNAAWWFGKGGMFDFTHPQGRAWWNKKMEPLYRQGVDFFKNDDGEYLPEDATSWLGMDGKEYHNLYGFFYGKAIYEGMQELDERRPVIYARSVWAGSQRFPALFMGDQKPTFDCLRRTLRSGLNMSLLGFSYWTADVFGLDGRTTEETHMRYAQWALLNPVARYFWRPPEIDDTRFPWSFNERVEANFKYYSHLRYRLLPYYYSLAWEANRSGLPLLRPMLLEYQQDERFAEIYDQVMIGERLMMAPVHEESAVTRSILLPEGTWFDFYSSSSWQGPAEIEYPAPFDRLPLLVKGGSILPMGPALEHIPDEHDFRDLELHAWPPYPAEAWIYDDDGSTRAYQKGAFSRTRITLEEEENKNLVCKISPASSGFTPAFEKRSVSLVLHAINNPLAVKIGEKDLGNWEYDPEEQTLILDIPGGCPLNTDVQIRIIFS